MARKNEKDYVYLIWKEPKTRKQFVIAKLSKNGKYEFEYSEGIEEALKVGFVPLIAFNDINKKYTSDRLFTSFSSRIPDRRRKDIKKILEKYGMDEYDEYKLLKLSGGRLPIDSLEFIDPIIDNGENPIERKFNVAGQRYYLGCDGENCNRSLEVNVNEELVLELEPDNIYDKFAIKICNKSDKLIGYVPRYYSKELSKLISLGWEYKLTVLEVNKDSNCNECLKVKLYLYLE